MLKEIRKTWGAYQAAKGENPHSLAIMEGPTGCNRACPYCGVHNRWNVEEASTLAEACRQVDRVHEQGFGMFQYVGGEPFGTCPPKGTITESMKQCIYGGTLRFTYVVEQEARFRTKEGITYEDHAVGVIEHASRLKMITNIRTNGDFVRSFLLLQRLKKAGLDILTYSLHSPTETAVEDIIGKARATAKAGIIPAVSMVFTADRAKIIPKLARTCAANGIFFSTSLVQEIGGGFSETPAKSNIPTAEQVKEVCGSLLPLRRAGWVINSEEYLREAANFLDKPWKCDPEKDAFVHVRAVGENGKLGVCSEVGTGLSTETDLNSKKFREKKCEGVKECPGCSYDCFFKAQNPDVKGDLRTLVPMSFIKLRLPVLTRMMGRMAVGRSPDIVQVPQSRIEKDLARDQLRGRTKERAIDSIKFARDIICFPVVMSIAIPYLVIGELLRKKPKY